MSLVVCSIVMDGLFEIIRYSTGSLFWGILIGVGCMMLFFFLIKGWYRNAVFNKWSYLFGAVLALALSFQCTLMCGAFKINATAENDEPWLRETIEELYDRPTDIVDVEVSTAVVEEWVSQSPLLAHYIYTGYFSGYQRDALPGVMIDTLKEYMNWFILRRVLWSLGFVIVGAIAVILTMGKGQPKAPRRHEREDVPMAF